MRPQTNGSTIGTGKPAPVQIAPTPHSMKLLTVFDFRNPLAGEQVPHRVPKKVAYPHQNFQSIEARHGISEFHYYFFRLMELESSEVNTLYDERNSGLDVYRFFYIANSEARDLSRSNSWHKIHVNPRYSRSTNIERGCDNTVEERYDTVFVLDPFDTGAQNRNGIQSESIMIS